jgi:nucleoside-diphosphate-sugar epimerase
VPKRSGGIIITGGNGFIGSHIVRAFAEHGVPSVCVVRERSDISNLDGTGARIVHGDITDLKSLVEAFEGFDFVIHNAARVGDWGRYEDYYEANVLGTLNVMEACLLTSIENVIATGTNAVYGEEDCRERKTENSPIKPHYRYFMDRIFPCKFNYYRDTKAIAAEKASEFAEKNGLNLTILDPVWAYGERELHSIFYTCCRSVKDGMACVPGGKKNKFHVIYARDLAEAYVIAYRKRLKGVHRFIIGDQEVPSMHEVFSLFFKEAGLRNPTMLPKWVFYPIGFLLELLYTAFKAEYPPVLTRGRVNTFYDNIEYSVEKAYRVLGFKNNFSLEQGIRNTVRWYKQNNLL